MAEFKKVDGVFEGGGVKGIGHVGAYAVTWDKGYRFENVAGTSAGAIVAALIAAGYAPEELKTVIGTAPYTRFEQDTALDKVPLLGHALSLGFERGIYRADYFEGWVRELLAAKNVHTFADLISGDDASDPRYKYKLRVVASDITRGRMLELPQDIAAFGLDPDALEVAHAVRMSMSIPFFFAPVVCKGGDGGESTIVDGGVLSNFPVGIFDDGTPDPPWPTFGYKLVAPDEGRPHPISGPITLLAAMFQTMLEAHDARYIEDKDFTRTIAIPTLGVQTTDFGITPDRVEALYQSGVAAAETFFATWNFDQYKAAYRQQAPPPRTARVHGAAQRGTAKGVLTADS